MNGNVSFRNFAPLVALFLSAIALFFWNSQINTAISMGSGADVAFQKTLYELSMATLYSLVLSVMTTWIIFWIYDLPLIQEVVFPASNEMRMAERVVNDLLADIRTGIEKAEDLKDRITNIDQKVLIFVAALYAGLAERNKARTIAVSIVFVSMLFMTAPLMSKMV